MATAGLRVVALSGGVGGARLVDGLRDCLDARNLLVIANTADDFEHFGLPISPDLDTVMYTLAGLADPEQGWGLAGETWNCLEALSALGGESWFRLGDRDLATHLRRAELLSKEHSLSAVTRSLCERLGVAVSLVPMCDSLVRTIVKTAGGEMSFQHYFVHEQCRPVVHGFRFDGIDAARPSPAIDQFCTSAPVDAVIICPSNPFVSVDPILAVPGMQDLLSALDCPRIAVSPIIGGRAVKGPAAKMLDELGMGSSSEAVAAHFQGFIDRFVIDTEDEGQRDRIGALGMRVLVTDTLIKEPRHRRRLAGEILTAL